MAMRARLLSSFVLSAVVAAAALAGSATAGAATDCDRFAATTGSDAGTGTLESPYATAEMLAASLGAGETGCFRAGSYGFAVLNVERPGITLAPYGSEDVTLNGDVKVLPAGAGSTIEGLGLNGAAGEHQIGPRIYADGVILRDNEITNQHTGICVTITSFDSESAPRGVVVERNRIHDCGRLPATNHDHGIYIAQGRGTIVRDNWIYSNADRGIQQYPDTQGSLITGNVIDSNGQGVNFGGDDSNTNCSNDNIVEGNIITDSRLRWNAYSGAQGKPCSGNVVRRNCVHAEPGDYEANGGIEPDSRSFDASGNVTANPGFVAPGSGDYRLQADSACLPTYTGAMSGPGASSPPGASPPPPASGEGAAARVALNVSRRLVPVGRRVRVRGSASPVVVGARKVTIERRRHGRWRRAGQAAIRQGGRFKDRVRVRGGRVVKLRARVRGVGRSRVVRVRVRR